MSIELIQKINSLFKQYDTLTNIVQICEKCFKEENLLICEICKLHFHLECENQKLLTIPEIFFCTNCKNFKSPLSVVNKTQRLDGVNFSFQDVKNENIKLNKPVSFVKDKEENSEIKVDNITESLKRKKSKKEKEPSPKKELRKYLSGNSNLYNSERNPIASTVISTFTGNDIKKEPLQKLNSNNYSLDLNENGTNYIHITTNQSINTTSIGLNAIKQKNKNSVSNNILNNTQYTVNANYKENSNYYQSTTKNNILSNFLPTYYQHRTKFNYPYSERDKDKKTLNNFENTDINFKKRKIKIGDNHNINFVNYMQQNYKEQIDDQENHLQPRKMFCPNELSDEVINQYLKDAMFFWNYREYNLENSFCSDFMEYIHDIKKETNDFETIKMIDNDISIIKSFIKNGLTMNNHFTEMALKILHLCNYSVKKAIYLIYKEINPFLEEEIEGFKSDVNFLQREAIVNINETENDDK